MIVDGEQAQLMESAFQALSRLKIAEGSRRESLRHVHEIVLEHRLTEAITRAEGPFPAYQLVGRDEKRLLLIIQVLAKPRRNRKIQLVGERIEGPDGSMDLGV